MTKAFFAPLSVAAGFAAGLIGKRIFAEIWAFFDEQEPPEPTHRRIDVRKMLIASALEGAVFYVVRRATDRSAREAYASLTGTWPGEEEPEPEP